MPAVMSTERSLPGPTSRSVLSSTLEQLTTSRTLRLKLDKQICVAVIAIDRYLANEQQHQDRCGSGYMYDVTVADGKCRAKCFLATNLNDLVHKNALRCGTDIRISQLSFVYDERRLGQSFVCLENIDCDAEESITLRFIKDLSTLREWSRNDAGGTAFAQLDGPLQTCRKHYLALWNNEDPHGRTWIPYMPPTDVVIDVSKICLLGDLDSFYNASKRPLPLLVRIMYKSRLRYYGKPGQNIDFPYQAYFEVADQSGTMSLVLWNDLCPKWYQRLSVGTVIYLQQYTLKRSYQNRSRPQNSHLHLMAFHSIEICLNPRNPSAIVTVIPPKSVQPQWGLPDVMYNFITRAEVERMAANDACDIIGLVTFVGRAERIRCKGNTVPEKFWTYRWVHAVDGTSDSPFILEIFASSQPEIFNSIAPMTYLVCTQMRVCLEAGSPPYLTSSNETQLFVTGCHRRQPYVSDPRVKAFIQWTKTLKDNVMLRKTAVGGHFNYPPAPLVFTSDPDGVPNQIPLVAVADLKGELAGLQYRERRRLAIQGQITAVRYHPWPEGAPQPRSNPDQNMTLPNQHSMDSMDMARRMELAPPSRPRSAGLEERSDGVLAPSVSGSSIALKRKRIQTETRGVKHQYLTRAVVQTERTLREAGHEVEDDEQNQSDNDAQHGAPVQTGATESLPAAGADQCPGVPPPSAQWESTAWPLLKQEVKEHLVCGCLDQESVPERFHFDDRELLLQQINLQPASWTPELSSHTPSHTHSPVSCVGYFTLTVLGLNQQMAVDVLFVPVTPPEDPRSVAVSNNPHDNTMLSCLSSGHLCPLPGRGHPSLESLLGSAGALDRERMVCVLDLCLLGNDRVEMICSKVCRTADVSLA